VRERREPWSFTELVGHYTGVLLLLAVPRESAAALLPPEILLGEQPLTPAGLHPVLLWFGRQREVHLTHLRHLPGFPIDYLEAIGGVPFVHPAGSRRTEPCLNLVQLYLDAPLAILGGVTLWGFPKKPARMHEEAQRFEACSLLRREPLLRCETELTGPSGPATRLPHVRAFAEVLAQPLLQGAAGNMGPAVGSLFRWALAEAAVQPARVRLRLFDRFLPGLAGQYTVPSVEEAPLGALHLESHWRLSLPYLP